MKVRLLMAILIALTPPAFWELGYLSRQSEVDALTGQNQKLIAEFYGPVDGGISPAEAINILDQARQSHVYWATHPGPWQLTDDQDAQWVIAYTKVINLIKELVAK